MTPQSYLPFRNQNSVGYGSPPPPPHIYLQPQAYFQQVPQGYLLQGYPQQGRRSKQPMTKIIREPEEENTTNTVAEVDESDIITTTSVSTMNEEVDDTNEQVAEADKSVYHINDSSGKEEFGVLICSIYLKLILLFD